MAWWLGLGLLLISLKDIGFESWIDLLKYLFLSEDNLNLENF